MSANSPLATDNQSSAEAHVPENAQASSSSVTAGPILTIPFGPGQHPSSTLQFLRENFIDEASVLLFTGVATSVFLGLTDAAIERRVPNFTGDMIIAARSFWTVKAAQQERSVPEATDINRKRQRMTVQVDSGESVISQGQFSNQRTTLTHGAFEASSDRASPLPHVEEQIVENCAAKVPSGEKASRLCITDMEGIEHYTRTKADLPKREEELAWSFRAMEVKKRHFFMTSDFTVQAAEYLKVLSEQSQTREKHRNPIFAECGLWDRIDDLPVIREVDKLRLLLIGNFRNGDKTGLGLDEFAPTSLPISSVASVCPTHNRGLVNALGNFERVMQVVLSPASTNCTSVLVEALEGFNRPLELIPADFLKHAIEVEITSFFRTVRSIKKQDLKEGMNGFDPTNCATTLKMFSRSS